MQFLKKMIFLSNLFFYLSCDRHPGDNQIKQLLKSDYYSTENLIIGAYEAGETGKKEFVGLLLKDANNPGGCTNIHFKGFSVYQEKMIALRKIFKVSPPDTINSTPDSVNIKFYINLFNKKK